MQRTTTKDSLMRMTQEPGLDAAPMPQASISSSLAVVRIPYRGYEIALQQPSPLSRVDIRVYNHQRVDITEFLLRDFWSEVDASTAGDALKEAILAIDELTEEFN